MHYVASIFVGRALEVLQQISTTHAFVASILVKLVQLFVFTLWRVTIECNTTGTNHYAHTLRYHLRGLRLTQGYKLLAAIFDRGDKVL